MGKRRSQRKHGSAFHSDDDSVSSSSTARSDLMVAQQLEDIYIDDNSIFDQCLDALHEKRGSTREKALSLIIEGFCRNVQYEFVEKNFATLLHLSLNSIKRGSVKEITLACKIIGLLALTVGCGENAHEILEDSVPIFSQALKSPSESSSPLLECLAIVTFVGGIDPEETEKSMQVMWQLVNPKLGSNVVKKKASAALLAVMVSSWSFLLTTVDGHRICSQTWQESISYFSCMLDKEDRAVRISAGEALALIFEVGNLEKFSVGAKHSSESTTLEGNTSPNRNAHLQGLKGKIISQVKILSTEAGGKGTAKKDLNAQRFLFRDIFDFLEDGCCPEISVKIGADLIKTSTWYQMIQLNFLKHFLGGGFVKHMQENEFLHDVFGFEPRRRISKNEKKVLRSSNSVLEKARHQNLNKQRMLAQDRDIGHFGIGKDDEDGST